MMNLVTQLISLFFSFCFGVFLFFIFKINYKYLIIRRYKLRIFFYVSIFLFNLSSEIKKYGVFIILLFPQNLP